MKRPFLLLTNDDGIQAPGIRHLWQAVHEHADVAIIAPHTEKSGCGLGITWTKPLHVRPVLWDKSTSAWSLNGTPADCVKMGVSILLDRKPDLILSGVNKGSNSGRTVLFSGTVGAIIAATFKGIPGIAFSFSDETPPAVEVTQKYILALMNHVLANPLPQGTFLNVNFPFRAAEKIAGLRVAKQGQSYWVEAPDKRIHPEGLPYYWLGGKWNACEEDPESDIALLEQGFVTAVPIHVNHLTDQESFQKHKQLLADSFSETDPEGQSPPAGHSR